jgi:hypothetical protein
MKIVGEGWGRGINFVLELGGEEWWGRLEEFWMEIEKIT